MGSRRSLFFMGSKRGRGLAGGGRRPFILRMHAPSISSFMNIAMDITAIEIGQAMIQKFLTGRTQLL
jgi:hypothetical protein